MDFFFFSIFFIGYLTPALPSSFSFPVLLLVTISTFGLFPLPSPSSSQHLGFSIPRLGSLVFDLTSIGFTDLFFVSRSS